MFYSADFDILVETGGFKTHLQTLNKYPKSGKIFAWVQEEVLPTSARVRQVRSSSGCVPQHD